jgi:carbon storage regulator
MLVLSRRAGERIQIGDSIEVTIVRISSGVVRIGIEAPSELSVVREEIQTGERQFRRTPQAKKQNNLSCAR